MAMAADLATDLWGIAEDLADVAAARSLPLFRSRMLRAENKAGPGAVVGFDPVTEADREAERAMRALLAARRPDDGILGEEFGPLEGRSGLTWVLDPIDGTRAFLSGATTWGTLIGLDAGEGPILGLIDQPYTRERFMGGAGRAEMVRDGARTPLETRPCASPRRRHPLHHLPRDRDSGRAPRLRGGARPRAPDPLRLRLLRLRPRRARPGRPRHRGGAPPLRHRGTAGGHRGRRRGLHRLAGRTRPPRRPGRRRGGPRAPTPQRWTSSPRWPDLRLPAASSVCRPRRPPSPLPRSPPSPRRSRSGEPCVPRRGPTGKCCGRCLRRGAPIDCRYRSAGRGRRR